MQVHKHTCICTPVDTHMYKSHIKMGGEIPTNTPLARMKIVWIMCNACMTWSALCRNDETVKEKADTTHTKTATLPPTDRPPATQTKREGKDRKATMKKVRW